MLPLALAYVMIIAGTMLGLNALGFSHGWVFSGVLLALNIVLVLVLFVGLDRGRLVSPAYGPMSERQLRELRNMSATRLREATEAGD